MEYSITIIKKPEFEDLTPDELLTAHDNRTEQIDNLKLMWTELNRQQTEILKLFYELEAQAKEDNDYNTCDKCGTIVIGWGEDICSECKGKVAKEEEEQS